LHKGQLCASPSTLSELEAVLSRDRFDRYLDRATRLEFFASRRSSATAARST
jgi:predicted nucleic acid-binding protein